MTPWYTTSSVAITVTWLIDPRPAPSHSTATSTSASHGSAAGHSCSIGTTVAP
jgi:hypothetical protein